MLNILVIGATGSIGRLVVAEALRQGHTVRALVRKRARTDKLPAQAQQVIGDLTDLSTLYPAVEASMPSSLPTVRMAAGKRLPSGWTTVGCAMF